MLYTISPAGAPPPSLISPVGPSHSPYAPTSSPTTTQTGVPEASTSTAPLTASAVQTTFTSAQDSSPLRVNMLTAAFMSSTAETLRSVTTATHSPTTMSVSTAEAAPPLSTNSTVVVASARAHAMTPEQLPDTSAAPLAAPSQGARRLRVRKAQDLQLNACICRVTITDSEIQEGKKVMKCTAPGCETVWVSARVSHMWFDVTNTQISLEFHQNCMDYEFAPRKWSCESCRAGSGHRRRA